MGNKKLEWDFIQAHGCLVSFLQTLSILVYTVFLGRLIGFSSPDPWKESFCQDKEWSFLWKITGRKRHHQNDLHTYSNTWPERNQDVWFLRLHNDKIVIQVWKGISQTRCHYDELPAETGGTFQLQPAWFVLTVVSPVRFKRGLFG